MRRPLLVSAVLVVSLLVSVAPAAGAHTAVVSIHTTDTDFNGASALENVTVKGSGTSAYVDWRGGETGSTADRCGIGCDDSGDAGVTGKYGMEVNPNTVLDGVNATVSSNTTGATTMYVLKSDGTVIGQAPISGGTANITTTPRMQPATTYYVAVDAGGSSFDVGYYSGTISSSSNDIDIKKGGWAAGSSTSNPYGVSAVTAVTGSGPGQYVGPAHDASDPVQGFADITVQNANVTIEWQGYDGTNWVVVDSTTYTTGGNKTASLSGGYERWRLNMTSTQTATYDYSTTLEDEGVTAPTSPPQLDNASASPSGGERVTETPTFSINGSDVDFGDAEGDTVTLDWYRNGELLGTATETTNGTWEFTPSEGLAGTSTWHVVATDEYGHETTSDTFSYESPSQLEIYNESDPTTLVNNSNATIEFYFGNGTVSTTETKTTSDGTVDMSGLPADQQFVVVVEAEGYAPRRIYVPGLYETQRVFVLPNSATGVEPTFDLKDYTGLYPPETSVLKVQRVLNGSWQTVEGDYFGATGQFPTTLARNERHQLVLVNTETGRTKNLGTFTPKDSETYEVTVYSRDDIEVVRTGASVDISPATRRLQDGENQTIGATVRSQAEDLSSWEITVLLQDSDTGANSTLATKSGTDPSLGELKQQFNLTGQAGGAVFVNVTYTLVDGTTETQVVEFVISRVSDNQFALLPVLGKVEARFPSQTQGMVTGLLAVIVTILFAGFIATLPGTSSEVVGLVAVLTLAGFAVISWIGYGPVFAGAAAWVAMAALRRGI